MNIKLSRIPITLSGEYKEISKESVLDMYKNGCLDIHNIGILLNILENEEARFYEYYMWSANAKVETKRGVPSFIILKKLEQVANALSLNQTDFQNKSASEIIHSFNSILEDIKIISIEDELIQKYVINSSPNATYLFSIKNEKLEKSNKYDAQPSSN